MGRRLPSQLPASLLRPLLQQRRPLRPSTAASLDRGVPRLFAAAVNTAFAVGTRSWPATAPSWRPSALAGVPLAFLSVPHRSFSSTGSPHIVVVESAEDFEGSLNKVQEGALPAIFYFSATWCAPCKFLAPVVNELSKTYPPCVTYKIDIDMEGIQNKLSELGISAVPTLKFYKDGKLVATVVGADVKKIKETMDELYK